MGLFSKHKDASSNYDPSYSYDSRKPLPNKREEEAAQKIAQKCWSRKVEILRDNPIVTEIINAVSSELNYYISSESDNAYTRIMGRARNINERRVDNTKQQQEESFNPRVPFSNRYYEECAQNCAKILAQNISQEEKQKRSYPMVQALVGGNTALGMQILERATYIEMGF